MYVCVYIQRSICRVLISVIALEYSPLHSYVNIIYSFSGYLLKAECMSGFIPGTCDPLVNTIAPNSPTVKHTV